MNKSRSIEKEFFTACPKDCYDSCSIISRLKENKIEIAGNKNHPITAGFLCYKSKHFVEAHYSPDRIIYPLLRIGEKGTDKFRHITWNEAIDIIVQKLKFIIKHYGPESILPVEYAGNKGLIAYYFPQRFFNKLGTSKLNHSICDEAGAQALKNMIGTPVGIDPEKMLNAKLLVYWGMNPAWTNVHGWRLAKRSKAKIYVIDPLKTQSAKAADIHIQLKVGTDLHLALGIMNQLMKTGLDPGLLRKKIETYTLEKTATLTGVDKSVILKFTHDLLTLKPSIFHIGYGFQRNSYSAITIKAIVSILWMMGTPRNFIYTTKHNINYNILSGDHRRKTLNQTDLAKELIANKIKMLFIYNTNPLLSLPNQNLLRSVLKNNEIFVVVHEIFMTDTTDFADLVLPATTCFEEEDLVESYYHDYLNWNQKITTPAGAAKSNHDLFVLLAKRFGFDDPYLFEDQRTIINKILQHLNIDIDKFYKNGFAHIDRLVPKLKFNFETFIKELEEYKDTVLKPGYFRVLSPTHIQGISGQYNNLYEFDIYARINPKDAKKFTLRDGDSISLVNEYGKIRVKVKIDSAVPSRVITIYKGAWPKIYGWNVNFITTDKTQNNYARGTTLNTTFVKLKKL